MNQDELRLKYASLKRDIKSHLSSFSNKTEQDMYKEFLFCLLTPQSNARKCWEAVEIIAKDDIHSEKEIASILKGRSRFHNTKAKRIVEAESKWKEIMGLIRKSDDVIELRNNISEAVNGYGLKEASHFLRNIGLSNSKIAILDRHIIRNLASLGAIDESDKMSRKIYLDMEQASLKFASQVGIPMDELDILFWHNEHEEFFK